MTDIKSMTLEELKTDMTALGEKPFRGKQIYEWMHVKLAESFEQMSNISEELRKHCKERYFYTVVKQVEVQESENHGTQKFLFELEDGHLVESIWMKYKHGNSVCISSQIGCRMGCAFCASTLDGLERSLTAGEMLEQIYAITRYTGERVSNVVVMGMGEPLDNYDNLIRFIGILTDENGLHISQRNITVSTCGLVPKIYQLADEGLQITLALSLHAATDEKRGRLMPIAKRYRLNEVMEACAYYFEKTGRRLTFEYSLVGKVNDSGADAEALAKLIGPLKGHVNLIPVNPIKERDFVGPDTKKVQDFKNKLEKYKINVTIRREMGRDIDGACGQLRRRHHVQMQREVKPMLKSVSLTDIGKKRKLNQDFVYTANENIGNLPNVFIVADGMGGHNAGDFASRCTVEKIIEEIGILFEKNPIRILDKAIQTANENLRKKAGEDEALYGMGTTIVAATCLGRYLQVANVGDSRLYVANTEAQTIRQITRDHSLVEEMVRLGGMDKEIARNHPDKHIITRAVGAKDTVEVDFFCEELIFGDIILLCSDGLSNMLEDEVIGQILYEDISLMNRAEELVKAANDNGGRDNIAVVIIDPFAEEDRS